MMMRSGWVLQLYDVKACRCCEGIDRDAYGWEAGARAPFRDADYASVLVGHRRANVSQLSVAGTQMATRAKGGCTS